MKFERLRLHNMGPFGDAEIDLTAIEGTLVALVGANGAGKSTALELLPGALFRQCPTRGKLTHLATARDSWVEATVCNGHRYTVRQSVDKHTGKGESLICREDGSPVVESGKVSESSRWVAEHFPSPDVLYSSSVSIQGRRGLLDMTSGERKSVLLQALRIDHLERLAEQARERSRAAKVHLATLNERLSDVPEHDIERLEVALAESRAGADAACEVTRGARVALDRAKAAAADAQRKAELIEQRAAVQRRLNAARVQVDDVETRLRNNRGLVDSAQAIRDAVARSEVLDVSLGAQRETLDKLAHRLGGADAAVSEARSALVAAQTVTAQYAHTIAELTRRLADADRVRQAVRMLDAQRDDEPLLSANLKTAEARVVEVEELFFSGKEKRIAALRTGHERIRDCTDNDAPCQSWAANVLAEDDVLAERAKDAPDDLKKARKTCADLREHLQRVRDWTAQEKAIASRLPDIERAEREIDQARTDHAASTSAEKEAAGRLESAEKEQAQARVAHAEAREKVEETGRERAALAPLLSKVERLSKAEARIEELEAQLVREQSVVAEAEAELATLPEVQADVVDLSGFERQVQEASAAERGAHERLTLATGALDRARQDMAKRAELSAGVDEAEIELSDWVRLGQDLGKDGLQALEIDAAIPEINTIANDLLASCHGSRFTVELRAEKLSADGKRSLEGLEMRVIDNDRGRDALAETYSGGECVIVGEAVSLALTTIACRRSGIEQPTLLRDETGAALDEENGRAYVAMLRMAARQIGARHVLYVSHTPELQQLADARILVGNGRLETQ